MKLGELYFELLVKDSNIGPTINQAKAKLKSLGNEIESLSKSQARMMSEFSQKTQLSGLSGVELQFAKINQAADNAIKNAEANYKRLHDLVPQSSFATIKQTYNELIVGINNWRDAELKAISVVEKERLASEARKKAAIRKNEIEGISSSQTKMVSAFSQKAELAGLSGVQLQFAKINQEADSAIKKLEANYRRLREISPGQDFKGIKAKHTADIAEVNNWRNAELQAIMKVEKERIASEARKTAALQAEAIRRMEILQAQAWKENALYDSKRMPKVVQDVKSVTGAVSEADAAFSRMLRTIGAFAGVTALIGFVNVLKLSVTTGMQFNKEIENSRIGIAGLLMATREYSNVTGTVLKGEVAWNAAMVESVDIQGQLQIANLKTAATFEQLLSAYRQAVVPAAKAGFTPQQTAQFSTAIMQTATAMGVPLDRLADEIRDILAGTMEARTTQLKPFFEAAGLTNEKIKQLIPTGQLFNETMRAMEPAIRAATVAMDTYDVRLSNLKDALQIVLGASSERLFSSLKNLFYELTQELVKVDQASQKIVANKGFVKFFSMIPNALAKTVEWVRILNREVGNFVQDHPQLSSFLGTFAEMAIKIWAISAAFKVTNKLLEWTVKLFAFLGTAGPISAFWKFIAGLSKDLGIVKGTATVAGEATTGVAKAAGTIGEAGVASVSKLVRALGVLKTSLGIVGLTIAAFEATSVIKESGIFQRIVGSKDFEKAKNNLLDFKDAFENQFASPISDSAKQMWGDFKDIAWAAWQAIKEKAKETLDDPLYENHRGILSTIAEHVRKIADAWKIAKGNKEEYDLLGELVPKVQGSDRIIASRQFALEQEMVRNMSLRPTPSFTDAYAKAIEENRNKAMKATVARNKEFLSEMKDFFKSYEEELKSSSEKARGNLEKALVELQIGFGQGAKFEKGLVDIDVDYNLQQLKLLKDASKKYENDRIAYQRLIQSEEFKSIQNNIEINRQIEKQAYAASSLKDIEQDLNSLLDMRMNRDRARVDQQLAGANEFKNYMGGQINELQNARNEVINSMYELSQSFTSADFPALMNLRDQFNAINSLGREAITIFEAVSTKVKELEQKKITMQYEQIKRSLQGQYLTIEDLNKAQSGILDLESQSTSGLYKIAQLEFEKRKIEASYSNRRLMRGEWLEEQAALAEINRQIDYENQKLEFVLEKVRELNEIFSIRETVVEQGVFDRLNWVQTQLANIVDVIKQPYELDIRIDNAIAQINRVWDALRGLQSVTGQEYTVEMYGTYNPTLPLGQAIKNIMGMLTDLGGSIDYKINFLAQQGMTTSGIGSVLQMMNEYANMQSQYDAAMRMTQSSSYFGSTMSLGSKQSWMAHYAQIAESLKSTMSGKYYEMLATVMSGMGDNTGGSSGGGGISVDVGPITINVSGAGNANDTAITIADRIDEEIASKIKSHRSLIPAALGL